MTKTLPLLAMVAVAALAGCNKAPTAVNDMTATDNVTAANEANVAATMPAAIVASKIYRCKDNSVAYVDWLAGGTAANIRAEQNGAATGLAADTAGGALKAEGYELTGTATDKTVTLTRPGKPAQACKA